MVSINFKPIAYKTDYFSMKEIKRMLDYCLKEEKSRDYMLLLTLARSGRRITEVVGKIPYNVYVGLRPMDIYEDKIEWDILKKNPVRKKDKFGKLRDKQVIKKEYKEKRPTRELKASDPDYLDQLQYYIKVNNIGPYNRVFPITRQRVDIIIKEIAEACKIYRSHTKIHAHMFRHSLVINSLKYNPYNPSVLSQMQVHLSHSSLSVTQGYAQFGQADIKDTLTSVWKDEEEDEE